MMSVTTVMVAHEPADLEGLPTGSRILTNHNKIFELDVIEGDHEDAGTLCWIEPGTLQPFPAEGLAHWLPAYALPPGA